MEGKAYALIFLVTLTVFSSGCIENIDQDGPVGQVLGVFGNFSSDGNSTTYEFSLDSLTDNAAMAPIQDEVDRFKQNLTSREDVEVKSTNVELVNVSSDSITVRINYQIASNRTEDFDSSVKFTMVNRNGQWVVEDPVADNFDDQMIEQNPRN
jgi:hypothetical protein